MTPTRVPREHDVVFVYSERTGEYHSLGAGWESLQEAAEYADKEEIIDLDDGEGRIGIEIDAWDSVA